MSGFYSLDYVQGSWVYIQRGMFKGVCTEVIHWSRSKCLWSKYKGACPKSYVQWSMSLGYSLEYVQGDKGYIQRGNSKGICLEVIHWSMSKGVGDISKGVCPREYVQRLFIGVCPRGYRVYPKG